MGPQVRGDVSSELSSQSVQWSGRCHVHELPDRTGDPEPDRRAGTITIQSKFLRPYRTFHRSLIAVAFQHPVGDAPNVDFRYHARKTIRPASIYD